MFRFQTVVHVLLEGRLPLEPIAMQLDNLLGLSFENAFSFSLAAIIFKGIRHTGLRDAAEAALRSLLGVTLRSCEQETEDGATPQVLHESALGYYIALLPVSTTTTTFRQLHALCGLDKIQQLVEESNDYEEDKDDDEDFDGPSRGGVRVSLRLVGIDDPNTALLVTSFVSAILTTAQGDDAETDLLFKLLSDIATAFPEIIAMGYDGLQDRIKDTFANSSKPSIIHAASKIFRITLQDPARQASLRGSSSTLGLDDGAVVVHGPSQVHLLALDDLGMRGLASSFQFLPLNRGHATKMITWIPELVNRIIE